MFDVLMFFMSGLAFGVALTFTYYDNREKKQEWEAILAKIETIELRGGNGK